MKLCLFLFIVIFCVPSGAQVESSVEYLTGQFKPTRDARFKKVGKVSNQYLRKEAIKCFEKMKKAAQCDKCTNLEIVSATRTFNQQKNVLWEPKWKGEKPIDSDTREKLPRPKSINDSLTEVERAQRILDYSAMPGLRAITGGRISI